MDYTKIFIIKTIAIIYDSKCSFLNRFKLLSLFFSETSMPHRSVGPYAL